MSTLLYAMAWIVIHADIIGPIVFCSFVVVLWRDISR